MVNKLYYTTITPLLHKILLQLMKAAEFKTFRLVGGTSLSLQRGHRFSIDIDLFTDAEYGTIDFNAIDTFLRSSYPYVDTNNYNEVGMGKSYYVGENEKDCIKLDLFYTEPFVKEIILTDGIRLASVEEIIAMKMDIISRSGRKKDFWDIHELKDDYSTRQMLDLHKERYEYTHDEKVILSNFTDFENADTDFDPVCLRNKSWEVIKSDIRDFVNTI